MENTQITDADIGDAGSTMEEQVASAVDSFVESRAKADGNGEPSPEPEPEKGEGDKPDKGEDRKDEEEPKPKAEEPEEIDEALLERAVRAGLSMKEARGFGSSELLASVIGKLESKADTNPGGSPDGQEQPKEETEIDIPDLDPNEWDEKIVNAFKALKTVAVKQAEEIRKLRSAGESARQADWIDAQMQGLDEAHRQALGVGEANPTDEQTAAKSEVLAKFKLLEAGYAATGAKAGRGDIFREAVNMVVGKSPAKIDRKAALEKRNALSIARPSHERAAVRKAEDGADIDEMKDSVAAIIAKQFNY